MQFHFKLLFISVLCINSTLYTQTLPPIQSFPMEEYAAGNQNWMVAQGSDREIYVANNEGVLVFDAYRWKLYPTNSIVRSVVVLDGILYSGSYMDFGYWEKHTNGELSYHSLVEKHQFPIIEDEQFWNIYLLDDTLIFQSLNRLILLNRETSEIKSITPDLPITKSFVIDNRLFFQLESDGVYELDGNGITYLFGKSEFKNTEVIQLFPLSDGFRVLTSTKGLFSYRNNRLLKWNILQDDFLKDLVYSGLQSANGDYVIGTVSNGLYIISENGRKSKHYNFEKGLLNNTVLSIYEDADFAGMHAAGKVAAQILDDIIPFIQPGVTTAELDAKITEMVNDSGSTSATIGYKGYQHASCISMNHVVCHGIPSEKKLKDGDILNIDVTVIVDGWFGDTSRMYVAGSMSRKAERLIQVTHDALMLGIEEAKTGNRFGDIGHAIQSYVESHRMSVVRDFCGHGLGRVFHAAPNVLHYGRPGTGPLLEEGMFFTSSRW